MRFWQRSLRAKLMMVFLLLTIIPVAVIVYMGYESGRAKIVRNTEAHLQSVAVLKKQEIGNWLKHLKHTVVWLASNPQVAADAAELVNRPPEDPAHRSAHNSLIAEFKRMAALGHLSPVFFLDAANGRILASSDPAWEGQFRDDRAWFTRGKSGAYVSEFFHSLPLGRPTMVVSAPVTDGSGRPVGVLAGHADLEDLSEIMLERSGLGETGETYLVNQGNLLLTGSRFEPGVAFKKWAFTEGVRRALEGRSGVGLYRDYRGNPVIGAYLWLENMEAALLAEIDQSEALAPVVGLRNNVLAVGSFVALLAALMAVVVARAITDPVGKLVKGVEQIGRGNLDHRVEVEGRDEIGRLAEAFNTMARDLQKVTASRDELDKEVAERRRAEEALRSTNQQLRASEQQLRADEQQLRASEQQLRAEIEERKRTAEALRKSRERFRRAIQESPYPIMIHAEDGEVIAINKAWTEITGYTFDEISTIDDWTEKAYGERKPRMRKEIDALYGLERRKDEGEYRIRTKDGEERIWFFSSAPLAGFTTDRRTVISSAIDMTEQKRYLQKIREISRFPDESPDPVLRISSEGELLYANRAARPVVEEWKIKEGDPVPAPWRKLIGDIIKLGEPEEIEQEAAGKTFLFSLAPIRMDGFCYCNIYGHDITDRKEAEERARTYLAAAPLGVFVTDRDGNYREVNRGNVR